MTGRRAPLPGGRRSSAGTALTAVCGRRTLILGALALAGCAGPGSAPTRRSRQLFVATGNTTGVYYQLGGGLADLISQHLPGYEATAEPTGASVENIQRVVRGDADLAFTLADTAGDAATGKGPFEGRPQPIRALAKLYLNYTQVIARTGSGVRSLADMRGKRISTGSPRSGTEVIALRLLAATGIGPDDITGQPLSLPQTVKGMLNGSTDAMVYSSGLPASGITELLASAPGKVEFLSPNAALPRLSQQYGDAYTGATIPRGAYNLPADVATIGVPNLLVVRDTMSESLAHDLVKLLFDRQKDLTKVHPEAGNIDRATAGSTAPVPLHAGAARFHAGR
ncbi:TAXI family TRAP transporter solute-binding subunit [Longispora urticae]